MKKQHLIVLLLLVTSCVPAGGQDLYSSSVSNNATADAARQMAQFQEQFLTASAQAPIVHITETAAAMAFEQQYWTATAQSVQQTQMAAVTQTAISWTPTPNATQTAVFLVLNAQSTQTTLDLQRQEASNQFRAIAPDIAFIVVLFAVILVLIWYSRRERYRPATVDERGRILPMFDLVEGTVTDIDRMPNYRGELREDLYSLFKRYLIERMKLQPALPAITAERQDSATQRAQLTDLASRGLPSASPSAQKKAVANEMEKQLSAENLQGRFKVLSPGADPQVDLIDEEIITVLDSEWKEAQES